MNKVVVNQLINRVELLAPGPQGPVGAPIQSTGVLYVSTSGIDEPDSGTFFKPYRHIQTALDFIGPATAAAEFRQPWVILPAPGFYDEDLNVPARNISILGLGSWALGDGLASGFDSTVPRSITINVASTDFGATNVKPAFSLGVLNASESSSTFIATSRGCHISGDIIIADSGGVSNTLNLYGVKVWGNLEKPNNVSLTNVQMYRCYIRGIFNAPSGSTILEIAENCEFDGLITVDGFNRMESCEIDGGVTVSTAFTTLPPSGMFRTDFSGTFTGPPGALRLDAATNFFFKSNGALLAGGATKVLLHDDIILGR